MNSIVLIDIVMIIINCIFSSHYMTIIHHLIFFITISIIMYILLFIIAFKILSFIFINNFHYFWIETRDGEIIMINLLRFMNLVNNFTRLCFFLFYERLKI